MDRNSIWIAGCQITKHDLGASDEVGLRRFREHFGITLEFGAIAWQKLEHQHLNPRGASPIHMLCAIGFLKQYQTESVARAINGMDEKTLRKWRWVYVNLLAKSLNVVSIDPAIVT